MYVLFLSFFLGLKQSGASKKRFSEGAVWPWLIMPLKKNEGEAAGGVKGGQKMRGDGRRRG